MIHRQKLLLCLALACLIGVPSCDSKEKQASVVAKTLYNYNSAKALHLEFSGEKALAHVQAQVDLGARPAGSKAIEKCREYLMSQLKAFGWTVKEQMFSEYTPKGQVNFVNLRARVEVPQSDTWKRPCAVLVGSHYDTKLFSSFEFVGANDAGSSTGVLLEMARVLGARPDAAQFLELVFFDGEEAMVNYTMNERTQLPEDGLYGSRYYVKEMRELPSIQRPLFMILLDMVGDKDLKIEMPNNSTPLLKQKVIESARDLGLEKFFAEGSKDILDDHHPFLVSGIKAVDIIDLNYPAWHTSTDKMDQISAESLATAGKTTLLTIEKLLAAEEN